MSHDRDLASMTAVELVDAYRSGALSPVEVHDAIQRIIAHREPELNAFSARDESRSRPAAQASEARWKQKSPRGPIDGVPLTLKENIARVGIPMRAGNAGVEPHLPEADAPVTCRVIEAGGVVLGSTVMPDWGMLSSGVSSLHGITRSPWNLAWTTGGSSAGASAAAAAGFGPLHVGTDIGGSIRLPGSWLGLVALKPSAGRVPLDKPYLGRAAGPMTRTVADASVLLEVISRPDARDWTALQPGTLDLSRGPVDPEGVRIGLHTDAGCGATVDPEVLAAVETVAKHFEANGAVVERLDPFMRQDLLDSLDQFWQVRSWNDYRKLPVERRSAVLPFIADWCHRGADISGVRVLECYQDIGQIQARTIAATEQFDFVISPVAPMAAFPAEQPMPIVEPGKGMWHIGFTAPYNMSGQPAISINCGFTDDRRPIGVQISGRRFDDAGVLRMASWYEASRPEHAIPIWPIQG